jgi:hypothetical protein
VRAAEVDRQRRGDEAVATPSAVSDTWTGDTSVAIASSPMTVPVRDRNIYDARASRPGVTPDDLARATIKSDGEHFALAADVAYGLGIAGAGITTYLMMREGRGESAGALTFGVAPGGMTVAGRF